MSQGCSVTTGQRSPAPSFWWALLPGRGPLGQADAGVQPLVLAECGAEPEGFPTAGTAEGLLTGVGTPGLAAAAP